MKTYYGNLSHGKVGGQVIWVRGENLEECIDEEHILTAYRLPHIERHSPDGFNWGYGGSGPADTALSILTDCLGEREASILYQLFKWAFVAHWGEEFSITEKEIKDWASEEKKKIELG